MIKPNLASLGIIVISRVSFQLAQSSIYFDGIGRIVKCEPANIGRNGIAGRRHERENAIPWRLPQPHYIPRDCSVRDCGD
jgi:hypothetical protein